MSLFNLALQQTPLEELIKFGLDRLPSDAFLEIARKLDPRIYEHYKGKGWPSFYQDLFLLVNHSQTPLDYDDVIVLWERRQGRYFLLLVEGYNNVVGDNSDVTYSFYLSLEALFTKIFLTLLERHDNFEAKIETQPSTQLSNLDLLTIMIEKNRGIVDNLIRILTRGAIIVITETPNDFSLRPLNETTRGLLFISGNYLILAGLVHPRLNEYDPEYDQAVYPYAESYSLQDMPFLLAILAYNQETFRVAE